MPKRSRRKQRLALVRSAAAAAGVYIVLDQHGTRCEVSPLLWAQYHASHAISPTAPGSPVARVRPGYRVARNEQGDTIVCAEHPPESGLPSPRSNFWTIFWRCWLYSDGRKVDLADALRALAEDQFAPAPRVVARRFSGFPTITSAWNTEQGITTF